MLLGFAVGIAAGALGFGGGFIITPALFALGLPMNVAVGTGIAQIAGVGIIGTIRHGRLGNVDGKLGLVLSVGAIFGVETGAYAIQVLKRVGQVDIAVSITYVVVLGVLSIYMMRESYKKMKTSTSRDVVVTEGQIRKKSVNMPPMIMLPMSGIRSVSIWIILAAGYSTGLLAGFMGVGGGFVGVPLLIYMVGIPTAIAIGTQLFVLIFSSSYGGLTHALKGNVDVQIAIIMLIGSASGAWIGPMASKYLKGPNMRFLFGVCAALVAVSTVFKLSGTVLNSWVLTLVSQIVIFGLAISLCCFILVVVLIKSRNMKC